MTDEEREQQCKRIAIEVEDLEPAYAQIIYNRRLAEMDADEK